MTEEKPVTCSDCHYCVEGDLNPQDLRQRLYNCYRYPPVPSPVPAQQGIMMLNTRPTITPDTLACGELEPKTESATDTIKAAGTD